jgi:alpha-amylase/alpha-mannosidase (GH57 family)
MRESLRVFEETFGTAPAGCWPSEGAISAPALRLIEQSGFRWAASSANVLRGCLAPGGGDVDLSRPYQLPNSALNIFFRNDELSDLIGFAYSKWHGDDAVRHFVAELERVAREHANQPGHLAFIALDGENAWEHFPFNGYYFLKGLYAALSEHPGLELVTLSQFLDTQPAAVELKNVVAGSWVHGTLATWMGDRDKNAAWDLLVEAKRVTDGELASGRLTAAARARVERQLALCESSDWFWWFGDYNPFEAVRDFDLLYRHQLTSLYRMLELPVPAALSQPLSTGRGSPEGGGVMRRAHE